MKKKGERFLAEFRNHIHADQSQAFGIDPQIAQASAGNPGFESEAQGNLRAQILRKQKSEKYQRVMKELLVLLHTLNRYEISLKVYLAQNPLCKKAFSRPLSHDFFKAVKLRDALMVKKLLIKDRYLVYCVDPTLKTALHWSVIRGSPEITAILLEYKPNFSAMDISELTPVDYVLKLNDYKELMRFILHGANPFRCGKKTKNVETGLECSRVLEVFKLFWLKMVFLSDREREIMFHKKKKFVIQACNYELEKYQKFGNAQIDQQGFSKDIEIFEPSEEPTNQNT